MHLDVNALNNFYYRTHLGRFAKRKLQESTQKLWGQSLTGQIAGFGFASPVLSMFLPQSSNILCLMPGQQGVMSWPTQSKNCSILVEETSWPIATGSVDRLIVMHGLETSERLKDLLHEIWRVLAPSARVIFVVPNRSGWWARSEATPFGQGRPYSIGQLKNQLKSNRFKIEQYVTALYAPPSERLHLLKSGKFLESLGERFDTRFGAGVILLEASKQIYALTKPHLHITVSKPLKALEELAEPKPI
jgi:hypothetical protein